MSDKKEYVITLKHKCDLDQFYHDMEHETCLSHIPDRAVECCDRRPNSRNTTYLLSQEEVDLLKNDERILTIELHHSLRGISGGLFAYNTNSFNVTQDPNPMIFNKSATVNNTFVNWGELRVSNGNQITDWGNGGTQSIIDNVQFNPIGRNVDVVIVDGGNPNRNHPEFAVNYDGTGGSRMFDFDWFSLDPIVKGTPQTQPYSEPNDGHATHVSGTVAGNRQGYARAANIYNIYYDAGSSGYLQFDYVMQYVQAFHQTKPVNPLTGRKNPTIMNNSWGMSIFPDEWSFSDITAVTYRGTRHEAPLVIAGFSGVCSSSLLLANLNLENTTGNRITTSAGTSATVSSIPYAINGTTGLVSSTTPDILRSWRITLPFPITYLGSTYTNQLYINQNWSLTFLTSNGATFINASNPALPKICFSSGSRSIQRIWYGSLGTAPNRQYVVRIEGNNSSTAVTSNSYFEFKFYEASPSQIDFQVETNNARSPGFSTAQLNSWGFIANKRIPVRVAALDADLEDAINAGVITVGAAGNGQWYHDVPGGLDWNNTFEMNIRYPGEVYYYMRGSSPSANDTNIPNICVGSIDFTTVDRKSNFSDYGSGIDIWAPGSVIMSSYYGPVVGSGVIDPRSVPPTVYELVKLSGTSMASPQVCGVIACYLELYPRWSQTDAKAFIIKYSKANQITSTNGGYVDPFDIQNSPNRFLYYPRLLPTSGPVGPSVPYGDRPASGQAWPRPRIYRYGNF